MVIEVLVSIKFAEFCCWSLLCKCI